MILYILGLLTAYFAGVAVTRYFFFKKLQELYAFLELLKNLKIKKKR